MTTFESFKNNLKSCKYEDMGQFIDDYIINVVPAVFNGDSRKYTLFRKRVAKKFKVSPDNVYIVGSGCLGFSYTKNGKKFDLGSDIDVAIVDETLYEQYSRVLSSYHYDIIYHRIPFRQYQRKLYYKFLAYYAVGWLRPDKGTDIMNKHPLIDDWWGYFRSISHNKSEVGNHKVNAGIYKSMYYLHKYQEIGLLNYRKGII